MQGCLLKIYTTTDVTIFIFSIGVEAASIVVQENGNETMTLLISKDVQDLSPHAIC